MGGRGRWPSNWGGRRGSTRRRDQAFIGEGAYTDHLLTGIAALIVLACSQASATTVVWCKRCEGCEHRELGVGRDRVSAADRVNAVAGVGAGAGVPTIDAVNAVREAFGVHRDKAVGLPVGSGESGLPTGSVEPASAPAPPDGRRLAARSEQDFRTRAHQGRNERRGWHDVSPGSSDDTGKV